MLHADQELRNWHDWTDPDFFATTRHHESRVVPLFLRQILPARLLRTKMTLTGWCLIVVSFGLGAAAYNTASNILFLALSLLLSSLILSGILSLINFKKLDWNLRAPTTLRVGEEGIAEINLVNKKNVFPSMGLCFKLQSETVAKDEEVYMQTALDPGASCKLKWFLHPQKRGQFELWLSGIQSKFPFGFLQKTIASDLHTTVTVWPARVMYTFPVSNGGQQVMVGTARDKLGQGSDLLNIRPYERGDAPRCVHWKATARTGRLMIRQLAHEGESGYHLYVDPDAAIWDEAQFERLCSLVCSLAEDLFHSGRLETVKLGGSEPIPIRTVHNLHMLFDQLSLLKRQEKLSDPFFIGQPNQLTFGSVAEDGIAIYLEGSYVGQIDD